MSPEEDKQSPEKEFVGNTTLHGLNRIVIAPSGYFQALWVLVILGSYAGFAFMFSSMIMDYFRYDTITDTKLKFADAIPFPAVTICNMNKFDSTKLKLVEWSYLSPLLLGKEYSTSELLTLGLQPDETINSSIANISIKDFVLENGFDINQDRMALCYWRNEACSYLEEYTENFFSYGNSEVGLKLLVHDQDEPPQMDAKGIALAPGNHAFITVKRTVYENHGPPWGNCQDLQLEYYDTYTLPACYLECRSKHVVANCSCRPFFLPGTAPFCDPTQIVQCVIRVMAKVTSGELKCNCPVPCSMTKYSTSVSYSGWPNKLTKDYIVRTYSQTKDYMRENGVVFSVFYEQLNYERVRELKAMDGGQLASNIGGMMGLFIGASLLTILEVWEYLWMRLLGCLSKARRPRTRIIQVQVSEKNGGLNNGAFRS
ncbi:PREDICTED: acid-sensing ion channel 1-like isoform X2 [Branchiostoma belcheri]|uniref:Acid-sensing ion channel 1-like isoform X2 n=1 Tax=Branchiostoma belcheri TaxID=7741 RepID=A0A6P4YRK7_BRABE|nr:PREDICTED: acid-sensing ion channel 1-like isoform X2 [Branchiostoma belcheri]